MAEGHIWTQSMFGVGGDGQPIDGRHLSAATAFNPGVVLADNADAPMVLMPGGQIRLRSFCVRQSVSFQDFTPDEDRCISAKISKLVGEGKDQDQAVAQAIQTCAPEKARAFAEAAAVEAPVGPSVEGFEAAQAPDGTWTVFSVPVFSVHVDDRLVEMGEAPEHYGAEWLQRADEVGRAREAEGYMGPLHVRHHDGPVEVEDAGNFRMRGVRDFVYEGAPIPTNFVDFVRVPDAVFQRLRSGELPFRSVEIKGPEHAEILSIALLTTEVPFFRYGNFRIANEKPFGLHRPKKKRQLLARCYQLDGNRTRFLTFDFARPAVRHYSRLGDRLRSLREDKDISAEEVALRMSRMLEGNITGSTVAQIERGDIMTPTAPVLAAFARVLGTSVENLERLLAEGEEPEEEGRFAEGGAMAFPNPTTAPAAPAAAAPVAAETTRAEDVAAAVAQMLPILQQLMEMLQALAAREDGGAPDEGEAPPVQASNQPAEQRAAAPAPAAFQAGTAGHLVTTGTPGSSYQFTAETPVVIHNAEVSELRGQLAAVQSQLRKFTARQVTETQSAGDLKALEAAGADADDVKTYTAMAVNDQSAAKSFAASVVRMMAAQPAAPPSHGTEIPAQSPERSEVAAYIAMGPERHALARRKYQAWLKSSKSNSLEDYLRANVNPDSFLNPAPTTHS